MCASVSLFSKPSRKGTYVGIGLSLDPDVVAWNQAVMAAGSSIATSTLYAANVLVQSLKATGLWNKLYMVDLCAGANLTAALVRLKVPAGVARAYTNNNFVNADYTESTGLTGNGTTKFLDSLINPVSLSYSVSSFGMAAYVLQTASAGTSQISMGNADAAAVNASFVGWALAGTRESGAVAVASTIAGTIPTGSASSLLGLMSIVCNGDRNQTFYSNGTAMSAAVLAAGAFSNRTVYKMALNQNGTGASFASRRHGTCVINAGLSAAEEMALYNAIQRFETALKRNV